ncbi:MAG: stalk domain-containing protein [Capsulimonadales bacterium]|nr:stalk domain-containing protein [Capsulimonadales bacterium]
MANRKRLTDAAFSLAMPAALAASPMFLASPVAAQTAADLRILSPRAGESLAAGSFALDVSFKSRTEAAITTAELWVDGVRWVRRDLDAPQVRNVLSFDVDASTLTEGKHTFLVRVFDAQGGTSEKSITLPVSRPIAPAREDSASGPEMKFLNPGDNKRVSGIVELQLDAKPRNGANPYVTFYVDKQFKTLKNYPPYTFNWDTTTVENGYHTIEAMGYLDASNASTTRRVRVFVDNPGGNTEINREIPDLSRARQQAPVSAVTSTARPVAIPIRKSPAVTARSAASLAASGLRAFAAPTVSEAVTTKTDAVRTWTPRRIRPATAVRTATALLTTGEAVRTTIADLVRPASPVAGINRATTLTAAPTPADLLAAPARPAAVSELLPAHSHPTMTAVKRVAHGVSLAAPAAPKVMSAPAAVRVSVARPPMGLVPVAPHKTSLAKPRVSLRPQFTRTLSPTLAGITEAAPLQIAFDGRRIAFDVRPRVEKGLPIAPFRQIFEHTGGQVMWVKHTQTVRAVNTDREIVISVGRKQARVNGENVTMDRKATLERGRTIVPLSFVREALDVHIDYDPATGHLRITSKH